MSWRTVVIKSRCKLDSKMGYLVVRGEETTKVFIDEIALLLIENPAVSITGCLLETLVEKKVKVIFCDKTHSPLAELVGYRDCFESVNRIKEQIAWGSEIKGRVWTSIVSEKIGNQAKVLEELNFKRESNLLYSYIDNMKFNDVSNREGHAAKVYFNAIFGMDYTRNSICNINAALNYGYSIILSAFNREITASGYLTQLGIFHDNTFNFYNLSCDLMEPFRTLVDKKVLSMKLNKFESDEKHSIVEILNKIVFIDNSKQTVLNSLKIYVRSVINALRDGNVNDIKFYKEI